MRPCCHCSASAIVTSTSRILRAPFGGLSALSAIPCTRCVSSFVWCKILGDVWGYLRADVSCHKKEPSHSKGSGTGSDDNQSNRLNRLGSGSPGSIQGDAWAPWVAVLDTIECYFKEIPHHKWFRPLWVGHSPTPSFLASEDNLRRVDDALCLRIIWLSIESDRVQ